MRTSGSLLGLCVLLLGPATALAKPTNTGTTVTTTKPSKKARAPKEKAPCYAPEVRVQRHRGPEIEDRSLSLTFCDGTPNPAALDSLSVLARPRDVERPELPEIRAYQKMPVDKGPKSRRRDAGYVSKNVMRVHPGLITRLQRVADRFPGKSIEIISGHRPDARNTSRHHHGRALDLRVSGVSREVLRDFLRTFPETGVGYYPNSFFVHMDVREDKGYWVDRSGPGEKPDYGPWPPKGSQVTRESQRLVESAFSELLALEKQELFATGKPQAAPVAALKGPTHERALSAARRFLQAAQQASVAEHDEDDDLDPTEIERIRKEARAAIEAL